MSEQDALAYLRAEGFKGNIRLKEVARFDESRLGGGAGIVCTFDMRWAVGRKGALFGAVVGGVVGGVGGAVGARVQRRWRGGTEA